MSQSDQLYERLNTDVDALTAILAEIESSVLNGDVPQVEMRRYLSCNRDCSDIRFSAGRFDVTISTQWEVFK